MMGRWIVLSLTAAVLAGCAQSTNSGSLAGELKAAKFNGGVINGTQADGNEDFAKTVVLLYDKAQGAICTASILSDKLLVTAAHCVGSPATSLYVVFGTDLKSTDIIVRRAVVAQTTPVWDARQNEEFNEGDMALVGFVGGLPAGYRAANLLADASQLSDGQTVELAGYGTNDGVAGTGAGILRYADTTIKTAAYSQSEILVDGSAGHGACHGDSGGPAYVTINGQKLLIGVTSHGVNDPNNDCTVSATYTSIAFYKDWMKTTASDLVAKVDQFTQALKDAQDKKNAGNDPSVTPQQGSTTNDPSQAANDPSNGQANDPAAPRKRSHKRKPAAGGDQAA